MFKLILGYTSAPVSISWIILSSPSNRCEMFHQKTCKMALNFIPKCGPARKITSLRKISQASFELPLDLTQLHTQKEVSLSGSKYLGCLMKWLTNNCKEKPLNSCQRGCFFPHTIDWMKGLNKTWKLNLSKSSSTPKNYFFPIWREYEPGVSKAHDWFLIHFLIHFWFPEALLPQQSQNHLFFP